MRAQGHALQGSDLRTELAEILAAGLLRLRARQSSRKSLANGESSLDFGADQSVHADPVEERLREQQA